MVWYSTTGTQTFKIHHIKKDDPTRVYVHKNFDTNIEPVLWLNGHVE